RRAEPAPRSRSRGDRPRERARPGPRPVLGEFLKQELNGPVPTFAQLVAPMREVSRRRGMREGELDAFLEQETKDARAERKANLPTPLPRHDLVVPPAGAHEPDRAGVCPPHARRHGPEPDRALAGPPTLTGESAQKEVKPPP